MSKLPGFETFANFLRVSFLENLVSEKKSQFQFRRIWSRKKVSIFFLENLVIKSEADSAATHLIRLLLTFAFFTSKAGPT